MRLGDFQPTAVASGQLLVFEPTGSTGAVALPHPEAYAELKAGDSISIDDGRLTGTVERAQAGRLEVRLNRGGQLLPRKGFNCAAHPIILHDLCLRDIEMIAVGYAAGCRSFAVSFVVDGRECEWVRRRADRVQVIAKVERAEALAAMNALAWRCDGIWICRGDLGEQIGLQNLGRAVAAIDPRQFSVPLWMAGQVFEHLTEHADPTRSEVCHVHDLLIRGYTGIVMSDETAVGRDPLNATRVVRRLLDASATSRTADSEISPALGSRQASIR